MDILLTFERNEFRGKEMCKPTHFTYSILLISFLVLQKKKKKHQYQLKTWHFVESPTPHTHNRRVKSQGKCTSRSHFPPSFLFDWQMAIVKAPKELLLAEQEANCKLPCHGKYERKSFYQNSNQSCLSPRPMGGPQRYRLAAYILFASTQFRVYILYL